MARQIDAEAQMDFLKELQELSREIDITIDEVKRRAQLQGVSPYEMQYTSGEYVMYKLVVAKAQVIHSITMVIDL